MTQKTSQWIKVEDRPPEDGQSVWCYGRKMLFYEGWYDGEVIRAKCKRWGGFIGFFEKACEHNIEGVTHWIPLDVPEPPEVE